MKISIRLSLFALLAGVLISFNSCFIAKGASKYGSASFSQKKFKPEEIEALKNTTTVFLLREADKDKFEEFSTAIYASWSFTPCLVTYHDSINKLERGNYSIFDISGYSNVRYRNNRISSVHVHVYMSLIHPIFEKKRKNKIKNKSILFSRLDLFTTGDLTSDIIDISTQDRWENKASKQRKREEFERLVQKSEDGLKNWTPGQLALYLTEIQRQLKNGKRLWLYTEWKDKAATKRLHNSTLLIPDYIFEKYDKWNMSESKRHKKSQLLKNYKYKYKIVKSDELFNLIQSEEEVFVFDYVKSSTDKFIKVFSNKKGVIYQKYKGVGYNIKRSDFSKIAK